MIEDEPVIVDGEILSASQQATRARYEERRDAARETPAWVNQPEPAAAAIRSNSVTLPAPSQANPKRTAAKTNGNGNGSVNGNGNGHHVPPPATPPQVPTGKEMPPHRPGAKVLAMALFAAIDAAKLAQDYALQQGVNLEFDTGDIRAMAATLYIDARKEASNSTPDAWR